MSKFTRVSKPRRRGKRYSHPDSECLAIPHVNNRVEEEINRVIHTGKVKTLADMSDDEITELEKQYGCKVINLREEDL